MPNFPPDARGRFIDADDDTGHDFLDYFQIRLLLYYQQVMHFKFPYVIDYI